MAIRALSMATKKSASGEGVTDVTDAPPPDTFESIAVGLLKALVANGYRESPMHGIVLAALQRVEALNGAAPPAPVPMKAVE